MTLEHIAHRDIASFADDRVNLPREKANEFRAQAARLRERLEGYLKDHPDFSLRKMLLSGSLAKHTALRTLNDIDVACYISGADAPHDAHRLVSYLAERLRTIPNISADQVTTNTYSVTVHYKTSGLNVDVVPILYSGEEHWYGNLVSQDDGSFLRTSIPRHLEFARARHERNADFRQVVRLVKYWAARKKAEGDGRFRFKSFMIELVLARLVDQGVNLSDYVEALQQFFTYLARTGLAELVVFSDYYAPSSVPVSSDPVRIIDPVNADNNVARLYTEDNRRAIVEAALEAGDAIDAALYAPTKGETVRYWQTVFGPALTGA